MKRFRVVYWFSTSVTTERYITAANEDEARKKFAAWRDKQIVSVEEVCT